MSAYVNVEIRNDGRELYLIAGDGQLVRFHAIWLRDNAQDKETIDPLNGQRLITLDQIPKETVISKACIVDGGVEIVFAPEDKSVFFSHNWLQINAYDTVNDLISLFEANICTWDGSFTERVKVASFSELSSDDSKLKNWLMSIRDLGFAKMTGGPIEEGMLEQVVHLFGYIRETNYGRWFEVRTEVNPENLAFTGMGLQAHTDNPYRDPVPTIQILYCLENTVEGGDSIVVDGFKVIERMAVENPEWINLLASHSARFKYQGTGDVMLSSKRPMIEKTPEGFVRAVRFNNRSAAPFTDIPFDVMQEYYQAYRRFSELVDDPEMWVRFKLQPGECFIVDNTRVMHARESYSSSGSRWLQGAYADMDGLRSKLAVLENKAST